MSTVLFGYTPEYHSLLESLLHDEASRPLYLMPGDGRKSTAVRSVPVMPHQINEMTDFALTHQAEKIWILNADSLRSGAADDARAMGLQAVGPDAAEANRLRLKEWRVFALARSLDLLKGTPYPSARAAAAAALTLPALALSPLGDEMRFEGGEYRSTLRLRRFGSPQGEWLICPAPDGEKRAVTLRLREGVPELLSCPEGAVRAAEVFAAWAESLQLKSEMFISLTVYHTGEGWSAAGISPLPGPDLKWTKDLLR